MHMSGMTTTNNNEALQILRENTPPVDDINNWHPNARAAVLVLLSHSPIFISHSTPAATHHPTTHSTSTSINGSLSAPSSPNELYVVLTKRSSHLRTHGGEVALPGGKKDPEDADLIATALREANEEIGLSSDLVEILTTFKAASSKHNLLVTPVVGLLKDSPTPFIPTPNPSEVDTIFSVPLSRFLDSTNHKCMDFKKSVGEGYWRAHWFDYIEPETGRDFVIFGLTASILIHIAAVAYQRQPDFEVIAPSDRPDLVKAFPQSAPRDERIEEATTSDASDLGKPSKM